MGNDFRQLIRTDCQFNIISDWARKNINEQSNGPQDGRTSNATTDEGIYVFIKQAGQLDISHITKANSKNKLNQRETVGNAFSIDDYTFGNSLLRLTDDVLHPTISIL